MGMMKYVNGDIYEGNWKLGRMHGEGKMRYAKAEGDDEDETIESSCFEGFFDNGIKTEGLMSYECGDKFIGIFDSRGMKKNGTIFYKNGNKFEGEFEEGYRKTGVMTYKTGDKYTGEFRESLFHGTGMFTYPNGDVYRG